MNWWYNPRINNGSGNSLKNNLIKPVKSLIFSTLMILSIGAKYEFLLNKDLKCWILLFEPEKRYNPGISKPIWS